MYYSPAYLIRHLGLGPALSYWPTPLNQGRSGYVCHFAATPGMGHFSSSPCPPMLIRRNGSPQGTSGSIIPGMTDSRAVHVLAPAKINLYLEVLGKRPDGYHAIETLILAVELYDEITLIVPNDSGAVSLTCDDPELSIGPDNLVLKAARLAEGAERVAREGRRFG